MRTPNLESREDARSFFLTCKTGRGLVKGVAKAPDIAEEDIEMMFSTNVTGLINMTQAILPIYKNRDNGGRGDIINIGSIAGREGYPGGSIYCATKAAVRTFTDAMRRELIATRIRVMEVCFISELLPVIVDWTMSYMCQAIHTYLEPILLTDRVTLI